MHKKASIRITTVFVLLLSLMTAGCLTSYVRSASLRHSLKKANEGAYAVSVATDDGQGYSVYVSRTGMIQIAGLSGVVVTNLAITRAKGCDFSALKGQPLRSLYLNATEIADLTPLKDLKVEFLDFDMSPVCDLLPLQNLSHLRSLSFVGTKVADLTPLKGMRLQEVWFDAERITNGIGVLRAMPTLKTINNKPTADFWVDYDRKFGTHQ